MKVGDVALKPGEYVFGWKKKDDNALEMKLYDAHAGQQLGTVEAHRLSRTANRIVQRYRLPATNL